MFSRVHFLMFFVTLLVMSVPRPSRLSGRSSARPISRIMPGNMGSRIILGNSGVGSTSAPSPKPSYGPTPGPTRSRLIPGNSATGIGSGPSGTRIGSGLSGTGIGSGPSGTVTGSGTSGTVTGSGTPGTLIGSGTVIGSGMSGTETGSTPSGTEAGSGLSGSGIGSGLSGSGIGSGTSGTVTGSGTSGTVIGSGVSGTEAGSGVSGTEAGSGVSGTEAGSGPSDTGAGSGPPGTEVGSGPSGTLTGSDQSGTVTGSVPSGTGIGSGTVTGSVPSGTGIGSGTGDGSGLSGTEAGSGPSDTGAGSSDAEAGSSPSGTGPSITETGTAPSGTGTGSGPPSTGIGSGSTFARAPTYSDVKYSIHELNTFDLYAADSSNGPNPLLIYIHGGGWARGDKDEIRSQFTDLRTIDISVASINYRFSDESYPAPVSDVKAAIRFFRANADTYSLDPNRFIVAGSSAGAHLASLMGTSIGVSVFEDASLGNAGVSSAVQGAIVMYGASDFATEITDQEAAGCDTSQSTGMSIGRVIDCNPPFTDCMDRLAEVSPISHIDGNEPPFWIIHGSEDCTVAPRQTERLHEALLNEGMDSERILVEGGEHTPATTLTEENTELMRQWLRRIL